MCVCATETRQCITVTANPISANVSSRAEGGEEEWRDEKQVGEACRKMVHPAVGERIRETPFQHRVSLYHRCDGPKIGV